MADKNDKWKDNVSGFSVITGKKVSFYVDRECIICSVCSDCAPKNFKVRRVRKLLRGNGKLSC